MELRHNGKVNFYTDNFFVFLNCMNRLSTD